jgi:nucleotide-binding universal stress UspA family protein
MKKILVPVDYSDYSDNAVRYAIAIAKKINAEIHLVHVLEIPELIPMAGVMMWPLENFEELKEESDEDLSKYISKLKMDFILSAPYFPTITYSTEKGSVKHIINHLSSSQHFDLVVMGLAGANKLHQFFLGSNSRDVIAKTKVPLLLVPKDAAFAPDLSESDLNSIQVIARLFSMYDPEILLVHVNNNLTDLHDPGTPENVFLNNVKCKLNYSKIYYRHVTAIDVNEGLKWISENGLINILAMIHRHPSIFSRILDGSHTKKMASVLPLPLLVMPEDRTPIGR